MEEAEKRRERLRAMRMEAAAEKDVSNSQQQTLIHPPLSNPLLNNTQQPSPNQPHRFDFYTDPLSAFSSHKTPPTHLSPSPGSRNSEMSHSGVHQFHNSNASHQNIHQAGVPYYNPSPTPTGPMGFRSSFPGHQGSPSFSSAAYSGPQFHNSPSPGFGPGGSPYPAHHGSPNLVPHTQGWGPWPNNNPSPGLRYGGGPSPGSGRGRGRWDGVASPGGRGRGHAFDAQARSYYCKSMVEDPWRFLTPVIWQSDDDEASVFNSWGSVKMTSGPKYNRGSVCMTSSAKKARVSDKSSTEPSLAEFLAAAVDEEGGDDARTG